MPVIEIEVSEGGFHVPEDAVRQLGLQPGERARIEIRRAPDGPAISNIALRYACRKLGDAVGVGEAIWDREHWTVPLKVRGRDGWLGHLIVTEAGEIDIARSTTREELQEAADAASPLPPAA